MHAVREPSAPDTTGLSSHHRGTAQEPRPLNDFVQPCPRNNPVWKHEDKVAYYKNIFVGGDAHSSECPADGC